MFIHKQLRAEDIRSRLYPRTAGQQLAACWITASCDAATGGCCCC